MTNITTPETIFNTKNKYRTRAIEERMRVLENKVISAGIVKRVSSDMQVDADSLPMQEQLALEKVGELGGVVYDIYLEEALSASKVRIDDRPEIQRLMRDIEDGKVNYVIAYKRDRLFRNSAEFMQFLQFLAEHDCDIYYTARGEMQTDLTAFKGAGVSKIIESLLGHMAEIESAITSSRVSDTMISRAKNGKVLSGRVPIGYKCEGEMYVPVEEFREMKETIEDLYISGVGIKTIAKWLNGREVKGLPKLESKYPKPTNYSRTDDWNQRNITTILFSPFYTGHVTMNSRKNLEMDMIITKSPFIVPFRTMEKQAKINSLREKKEALKKAPRAYNTPFLLSGLLYCKKCGSSMKTQTTQRADGTRYSYYICRNSRVETTSICSMTRLYKKEIIEQMILEVAEIKLAEFVNSDMYEVYKEKVSSDKSISVSHANTIEDKIKSLQLKVKQYASIIAELDDAELKSVYLSEQKDTLNTINNLKEDHANLMKNMEKKMEEDKHFEEFIELAKGFSDIIKNASVGIKKQLLENLFSHIFVDEEGNIKLELKIGKMWDYRNQGKDTGIYNVNEKVPSFISLETINEVRVSKDIKTSTNGLTLIRRNSWTVEFNFDDCVLSTLDVIRQKFFPFLISIDPKLHPDNYDLIHESELEKNQLFDSYPNHSAYNKSKSKWYSLNKLQVGRAIRDRIVYSGHLPATDVVLDIFERLGTSFDEFIQFINSNKKETIVKDYHMLDDLLLVFKARGASSKILFKDVIHCKCCGVKFKGKSHLKQYQYICSNPINKRLCDKGHVKESVIIDKICEELSVKKEMVDRRFVLSNIKSIAVSKNFEITINYK